MFLPIPPTALRALVQVNTGPDDSFLVVDSDLTDMACRLARCKHLTGAAISVLEKIVNGDPLGRRARRILRDAFACHLPEIIDSERRHAAKCLRKAVRTTLRQSQQ